MLHYKISLILLLIITANTEPVHTNSTIPGWMKGRFSDDYGNNYTISDSLFFMEPKAKYHIIRWDSSGQFILTHNNENNPSEKGLYTRIDYMQFPGIKPFEWGFCLTVYDAVDTLSAVAAPQAKREIPQKGCNGFPFSRMKRRKD